jgi:ADP-heptose:LPS heptosyltransferase
MGLNLSDEVLIPKQTPNSSNIIKVSDILSKWNILKNEYVVVQLRASSPIRCPRLPIWKKIIDNITEMGINVIITDSIGQKNNIDSFIMTLNNKDIVFNFSEHSAEISHTIALVSMASLVVGVDSSLVHIAESVGVKSFGIYGPFKGDLRLGTYKNAKWVDATASCAPCFRHGNRLCNNSFLGYPKCFDNLNVDDINKTIEGMLTRDV